LDTHREFHFMGIGGAGMSGLAELLVQCGYTVTGCDVRRSITTDRLEALGVGVRIGHGIDHAKPVEAVVISSAIPMDNDELVAARDRGCQIVRRAELLGAVMTDSVGIAVAGTHGKSTTTTMIGAILEAAGWDPTVLVGGRIRGQDGNVRLGAGKWMVAEADEFDRSFLALEPDHAVITNIEPDHLDTYESAAQVDAAFAQFAGRVNDNGTLVLGIDDEGVRRLDPPTGLSVVTFGLSSDADVRGAEIKSRQLDTRFEMRLPDGRREDVEVSLPGRHNVLNALAAAAMGWSLGLEPGILTAGLASVRGVERRFEIVFEDEDVMIVDDYAHHPTEVAATLASARTGWPGRRLVAVFQPHLYSRTRDFANEFGTALADADVVFVTDVYPAREAPIAGVSGRLVCDAVERAGASDVTYVENGSVSDIVAARLTEGDLVVTLGAGDVDRVARRLAQERRAGSEAGRGNDGSS
jgi:UDP-N-acetylmuramate--alanine ligase